MASVYIAEELEISLLIHSRETRLFNITKDQNHLRLRDRELRKLQSNSVEIERFISSDIEEKLVKEAQSKLQAYFNDQVALEQEELSPLEAYQRSSKYFDDAYASLEKLVQLNIYQANNLKLDTEYRNKFSNAVGTIAITFLVIINFAFLLVIKKHIYSPLNRLSGTMSNFGKDNLLLRASEHGPLEIRSMARTFNAMAANLCNQRDMQLQFIAAIAHDIKNPLAPIKMAMDSFLEDLNMTHDEKIELITIIKRSISRIHRMADDLLDTTRIESGKLELKLERVDVRSLLREAVLLHQSLSNIHKIDLHLPDSPILANLDSLRISQVLNNILNNAIKYSPQGGLILVSLETLDGMIRIKIKDHGIGIDPSDLEHIFEPFRRSRSTRASIPGIGLGLAVSRRIIEAHGGRISVESDPGLGTLFTIILQM